MRFFLKVTQLIIFKLFRDLIYLLITRAPLIVYPIYFRSKVFNGIRLNKSSEISALLKQSGSFSSDWFSHNIQYWQNIFEKKEFFDSDLNVLEVGSWEGLSAVYILSTLKKSNLTCVDTWNGSDEHESLDVKKIEENFDKNTSAFMGRVKKFKVRSYDFFSSNRQFYDFIYIDGSHYSDDVLIDAIKSWQLLKLGGVVIFDDYLWQFYDRSSDNPALAINLFLKLKQKQYRILHAGYQIALEKIA
jgi:hypothetical protein